MLTIREFTGRTDNAIRLAGLEREVTDLIHETQLNTFLEDAKKAEFMGQKKKALAQYMEALYFLKMDGVDDALQAEHIGLIEAKIAELEGRQEAIE